MVRRVAADDPRAVFGGARAHEFGGSDCGVSSDAEARAVCADGKGGVGACGGGLCARGARAIATGSLGGNSPDAPCILP